MYVSRNQTFQLIFRERLEDIWIYEIKKKNPFMTKISRIVTG